MKYKKIKTHVEIYVTSPKHGEHTIYVDLSDWDKVKDRGWWVIQSKKTFYAACYNHETGHRGYRMHQLLMGATGCDHIDHNGLNNRRSNLRYATHKQNMQNKTINKRNKTGFRGVFFDRWDRNNGYRAAVKVNGKTVSGNRLKNPLLSAYQYNLMASHFYGEFAALNKFTKEQVIDMKKDPKFQYAENKIKRKISV